MQNLSENNFQSNLYKGSNANVLLNTLVEVNNQILQGVSYKNILDYVFESLETAIPYDRIGIALIEGKDDHAQLAMNWVKSKVPIRYLDLNFSSPIKGSSLQVILDENESRIINDLKEYSYLKPESVATKLILKDGVRANLTCPIRYEGKPIGVVFFSSCTPNIYREDHIHTFMQVADEISIIINHGRLQKSYDQTESTKQTLYMTLHDLKSPLSTLQGFAEIAVEKNWFKKLDVDARHVFQIFFRNTKYMAHLLNDLTEMSNLKEGIEYSSPKEVRVHDFCQEMFRMAVVMGDQKGIQVTFLTNSILPEKAYFDRIKISRVLDNLLSNAMKYSPRGTAVELSASSDLERLTFSVTDHGLGIPQKEFPKLFQEFGKTSVRPTEGETSSGQGLAIAKKIVEQHGGDITVESQPGHGSKFTFWIPLRRSGKEN